MLEFLDSNCMIGMRSVILKGSFYKTDDLLKHLNKCFIREAMVYHKMAEEYHPGIGNKVLMDEIEGYDNLYPVWVVMPNITKEFIEMDELINMMKKNKVKMVRIFPNKSAQNFSLSPWCSGTLFHILEKHRIPLMIGMDQVDYEQVYNLAKDYENLPIILTNTGYRADRHIYPLLQRFENIFVETSSYKVHFGLEAICKLFGPEKLIFGSGLPIYSGGSAVTMITHLKLDEKDKRKIAGDNLRCLLGGVSYDL